MLANIIGIKDVISSGKLTLEWVLHHTRNEKILTAPRPNRLKVQGLNISRKLILESIHRPNLYLKEGVE